MSRHHAIIIVVVLLAHGAILLNDGVHSSDDWYYVYNQIEANDFQRLLTAHESWGYPIRAYQHWIAGHLPSTIAGHNWVSVLSLIGIGLLTYQVGLKTDFLTRQESLFIALIGATYPAYQAGITLSMMPYHISYVTFLSAIWLLFHAESMVGWRAWIIRIVIWVLLVHSFWIYSFLSFYFGFLLIYFLRFAKHPRFILARLDLIVLPFIAWFVFQSVFVADAVLASDYYTPEFLRPEIFNDALRFIEHSVYGQLNRLLGVFITAPLLLIVLIGVGYALYQTPQQVTPMRPVLQKYGLLAMGLLLFGLGMFPYIAVGFYPLETGWWTRHALLVGLPMGLIIVGMLRIIGHPRLQFTILTLSVGLFTLAMINAYAHWTASWLKERAIMHDLAQQEMAQTTSIFWVNDEFPVAEDYRYHTILTPHLHEVWGNEAYIATTVGFGFELADPNDYLSTALYLQNVDEAGCQAIMTIRQGTAPQSFTHPLGLSVRFWIFDLFSASRMERYVDEFLEVESTPILAPQATECPAQQVFMREHALTFEEDVAWLAHSQRLADALEVDDLTENAVAAALLEQGLASLVDVAEDDTFDTRLYALYRLAE